MDILTEEFLFGITEQALRRWIHSTDQSARIHHDQGHRELRFERDQTGREILDLALQGSSLFPVPVAPGVGVS